MPLKNTMPLQKHNTSSVAVDAKHLNPAYHKNIRCFQLQFKEDEDNEYI